ncbi:MAG TPA: molybdopterin molybdenumtransferase MoeA, partial [Fibrobacteria bacterium]|nr:molybdopterin molybdenumtransferase MoeA [Fibrobacteria bacterium]
MIPVAEAEALILASLSRYPSVTLPIAKCTGRVLRAPVLADRAQPPFDRVALDGIAIAHAAWEKGVRAFPIEGRQKAGEPPKRLKAEGGCLEVMTGAVLPVGTDLVVPVEDLEISGKTARLRDPER